MLFLLTFINFKNVIIIYIKFKITVKEYLTGYPVIYSCINYKYDKRHLN